MSALCKQEDLNKESGDMHDLLIAFYSNPLLAVCISVSLLFIAGFPPMISFFIKFFVLYTAQYSLQYYLLFFLLVINVITSVFYFSYYVG